ncbi:PIN domain-containing protein [Metabacillus idriensis]|uniref:PIN domain-containing protein n=1 Tax=Metabacillus idriensis TaxID=324768 RepID=UPI00174D6A4D|nr:PIN domain-containing protein [Metabacillus idriensis]
MYARNALIADTNIFLYLFEPERISDEVFNRFMSNVLFLTIDLIVPKQIIIEWERHRDSNYTEFLNNVSASIDKHKALSGFINDDKEREDFLSVLQKIKKMELRKYKYTYGSRARKIDKLLSDPRTVILERNSSIDTLIVDFAIDKKPPFFAGEERNGSKVKTEAADATIFFTMYDYFKQQSEYENLYFVTCNKKDFSKPENAAALHENLQPYADEIGLKFFNDLNRALLDMNPDNIGYQDIFAGAPDEFLKDSYFTTCKKCGGEVHINMDSEVNYSAPPHLQTYFLKCHCGHIWDTGDLVLDQIY